MTRRGATGSPPAGAPGSPSRVVIIGCPGSGKSWLAVRLGVALDLPVFHLDELYWRPVWQPTPEEQWQERVHALLSGERWIIDGNYAATVSERLAAADWVVFCDLPTARCILGVLSRALRWRLASADRLPPYVRRGRGAQVAHNLVAFLRFVLTFRREVRPRLLAELRAAAVAGNKRVLVLRRRRELRELVDRLGRRRWGRAS